MSEQIQEVEMSVNVQDVAKIVLAAGVLTVVLKAAPPAAATTKSGIYGAIYGPDMRPVMESANLTLKGFPNIFTINPNSGPAPLGTRLDVEAFARKVKTDNPQAIVLGYVATKYGQQPTGYTIADLKAKILMWSTWRAAGLCDGISFDEQSTSNTVLPVYQELANYARSLGLTKIRGNPGTKTTREYIELNDVTSIHEGPEDTWEAQLIERTYYPNYPKSKFIYLEDGRPSIDATYMNMVMKYCGAVYITDIAGDPIRYQIPASYLSQEVSIIGGQT